MEFKKPSNGEIQALVKEVLDGIEGVTNTQVKTIATSVLNRWDIQITDYKKDHEIAVSAMQTQLDDAQKEIDTIAETYNNDQEAFKVKYETELPALQRKYDDEVAAHATFRTETENASKNAAIDRLYTEALTKAGLRPDLIPNELKLANRELLVLDKDGKTLKDTEKAVADAKTRWAEGDFAEERQGGASTFAPNAFTMQQQPPPNGSDKPNLTAMLFGGGASDD